MSNNVNKILQQLGKFGSNFSGKEFLVQDKRNEHYHQIPQILTSLGI